MVVAAQGSLLCSALPFMLGLTLNGCVQWSALCNSTQLAGSILALPSYSRGCNLEG